jgi:hypothetical protein
MYTRPPAIRYAHPVHLTERECLCIMGALAHRNAAELRLSALVCAPPLEGVSNEPRMTHVSNWPGKLRGGPMVVSRLRAVLTRRLRQQTRRSETHNT